MPDESKIVVGFGQKLSGTPGQVILILTNFSWHRLDAHAIPVWGDYKATHLDLAIRDKNFTPSDQSGLSEKTPISQVSFSVANQTAYHYIQVPFLVVLYANNQIVSVNRYVVGDLPAQGQAIGSFSIIGSVPPITSVDVVPDLNIFDKSFSAPIK